MTRYRPSLIAAFAVFLIALVTGTVVSGADAVDGFKAASSYDDDIERAKDKQDDYEQQLDDLEAALEDTSADIVAAARQLRRTEAKLPAAQAALDDAREKVDQALVQQKLVADKLAAAEAQDQAISDQIAADEERIVELQDIVAALARAQYQGVGDDEALSLVFGASTSQEFVDKFAAEHNASRVQTNALADVEEIAAVNRNRGVRQEAVREYIVELKAEADALVVRTTRLEERAEAKKKALDALVAKQSRIKARLEAKKAEELERQKAIEAKQEQTRNQIKNLVKKKLAEEEAKRKAAEEAARKAAAANGGSSSGSSGGSSSGSTTGLTKGALGWPAPSHYVTSSYGMRFHPILHYWRLHAGTDIRAYCGTPIYAAREGRVQWATYVAGLGNEVLIDHGYVGGKSLMSSYNHLSAFAVGAGQYVTKGQLVGYAGNTGTSAACHLHFEVYVNGDTVDPMTLIG
ncbi:M23 family metallopeptidase [Demequina phytophila]|uniref:M23 family metallopeptidase n=1 Tax=Demequina phytophila TaxID=1638981 RepID=UPI000785398E|nr:M23 family metallopeptidase [Demequina phytophila]